MIDRSGQPAFSFSPVLIQARTGRRSSPFSYPWKVWLTPITKSFVSPKKHEPHQPDSSRNEVFITKKPDIWPRTADS